MGDSIPFGSSEFQKYCQSLVDGMIGKSTTRIKVVLADLGPDNTAGVTDGSTTLVNYSSELVTHYVKNTMRFLAVLGLLFHETGHVKFLDFNGKKKAMKRLAERFVPGELPVPANQSESEALDALKQAIESGWYASVMQEIYHNLDNIISDVHDENKMKASFGPLISAALNTTALSLEATTTPIEQCDPQKEPFRIIFSLLLQEARYGRYIGEIEDKPEFDRYKEFLDKVRPHIVRATATDDTNECFTQINYMLMHAWELIREMNKEQPQQNQNGDGNDGDDSGTQQPGGNGQGSSSGSQGSGDHQQSSGSQSTSGGKQQNGNQSGSSGGQQSQQTDGSQPQQGNGQPTNGSSSGNSPTSHEQQGELGDNSSWANHDGSSSSDHPAPPTKEQLNSIAKQLAQAIKDAGNVSKAPEGRLSSQDAINDKRKEQATGELGNDVDASGSTQGIDEKAVETAAKNIISEWAREKAEREVEKEVANERSQMLSSLASKTSSHEGIKVIVERDLEISDSAKRLYRDEMSKVSALSRQTQRKLLRDLKTVRDGEVVRHRLFGSFLDQRDFYRLDSRVYSTKRIPEEAPDMAVCVLIDGSGSMSHTDKKSAAIQSGIIMYDVCKGLDIPCQVLSHRAIESNAIRLQILTEYERISRDDGMRIAGLQTSGCNRDGLAMICAAEMLAQRPEEKRVLVVISDGLPNHTEYSGKAACEDMQQIISTYRRRHRVETVGIGIDGGIGSLKTIYGDNFLDGRDLKALPTMLVKLLTKKVTS